MMNCLLMIMKLILLEFMTLSLPGASTGSDPVMSLPTTQTQMMTVPPSLHPSYFGTGYGYVMHLASFCISTALLVHLVEKLILIALLMLCCDAFLHSFMTILLHFIFKYYNCTVALSTFSIIVIVFKYTMMLGDSD